MRGMCGVYHTHLYLYTPLRESTPRIIQLTGFRTDIINFCTPNTHTLALHHLFGTYIHFSRTVRKRVSKDSALCSYTPNDINYTLIYVRLHTLSSNFVSISNCGFNLINLNCYTTRCTS